MTRSVSGSVDTPKLGVRRRILLAQPGGNRVHFRARRRDGRRRAQAAEDDERVRAAAPSFCQSGPKKSGCQSWTSAVGSSNPGGITPTTSTVMSLNWIDRPITLRSAPKRCCQRLWLMITVRVAAVKSAASKMRPSSGAVPRSSKKPGPTCPIWMRSAPGPPASVPRVNSGRM